MTREEVCWLAGLLEGEGCFSIRRTKNKLEITCGSTDLDIVEKIAYLVGKGSIGVRKKERDPKATKDFYEWRVRRREDVVFLAQILLPHMGKRRSERIQDMLKFNQESPKKERTRGPGGRFL